MGTSSIETSSGGRQRPALSLRDLLVTASQATLIAVLGASIAFAFAEPGRHGYPILIIGLPSFVIGPGVLIGYFLWVLGRTGRVMLLANAPVALFSGWLAGGILTAGVGDVTRPELMVAVVVALIASLTGIVAALRWPGPGARRAAT
ncbi:MAG: hypothetical protein H0X59_04310 [Chloroflexi bacterium]|nr:hypothetical protein [Chloroflexota bacterium]